MEKTRRKGLCTVFLGFFVLASVAAACAQQLSPKLQDAVGHWQVIDNDKPNGHVDTYLVGGMLFGRVTEVRPGRTPKDVCDKCSGDLKNQLILGMVIMRNFKPDGDIWAGGTVVDPENGKEYKGKIWTLGKDKLSMRGYIGISLLGRTRTWVRIP